MKLGRSKKVNKELHCTTCIHKRSGKKSPIEQCKAHLSIHMESALYNESSLFTRNAMMDLLIS